MTDRVQKLREKYFASRPCITAERLVLQTEAYKLFAGEAAPIFRAKVVNYIMEHMTTLIMDNELVVGTPTNKYRGANLHPEFQSAEKFYIPDIDEFPVRKCDPYDVRGQRAYSENAERVLARPLHGGYRGGCSASRHREGKARGHYLRRASKRRLRRDDLRP